MTLNNRFLLLWNERRRSNLENRLNILYNLSFNGVLGFDKRLIAKDKYNHLLFHYEHKYKMRFKPRT